jgi:hypothetical protein
MAFEAPFPEPPDTAIGISKPKAPPETGVVRGVLVTEAVCLAMGGLIAALLALITLASGPEWILYAAGAGGVSLALLGGGAALGLAASRLSERFDTWKLGVLALQASFIPVGWWAMSLEATYQAQNPGDHGPFADGSDAMISVLGFAFFCGGAVVLLSLLEERARLMIRNRETAAGP